MTTVEFPDSGPRECGGAKSYLQLPRSTRPTMAKRRKNRTHLKGAGGAAAAATAAGLGSEGAPKTFVVKHGPVGGSIAQLVRDVRKIMEPHTATRLRVWISASMRDVVPSFRSVSFSCYD